MVNKVRLLNAVTAVLLFVTVNILITLITTARTISMAIIVFAATTVTAVILDTNNVDTYISAVTKVL